MALTRAELEVDEGGCLRFGYIRGPGGDLPVWPPGYSLRTQDGETRVLDERDRLVARIGDRVEAGGGGSGDAAGEYEKLRRELNVPERCTGAFWIITPPVKRIGRG